MRRIVAADGKRAGVAWTASAYAGSWPITSSKEAYGWTEIVRKAKLTMVIEVANDADSSWLGSSLQIHQTSTTPGGVMPSDPQKSAARDEKIRLFKAEIEKLEEPDNLFKECDRLCSYYGITYGDMEFYLFEVIGEPIGKRGYVEGIVNAHKEFVNKHLGLIGSKKQLVESNIWWIQTFNNVKRRGGLEKNIRKALFWSMVKQGKDALETDEKSATPNDTGEAKSSRKRTIHGFDAVKSTSDHLTHLKQHEGVYLCVGISTLEQGRYFVALFHLNWDAGCLQARHMCLKSRSDSGADSAEDVSSDTYDEMYEGSAYLVGQPSHPMLMMLVEPLDELDEIMVILLNFFHEPPPAVLYGSYLGVGKTQHGAHPAAANLTLIRLNADKEVLQRASHGGFGELKEACPEIENYLDALRRRWIPRAELENFLLLLRDGDATCFTNPEKRDVEMNNIYHHLTPPPTGIADDRALRPPWAYGGEQRRLKMRQSRGRP